MRDCTITSIFLLIRSRRRNEKNVHHPNLSFRRCVCMCVLVFLLLLFSILLLPVFVQSCQAKKKDQLKLIIFWESSFITWRQRRKNNRRLDSVDGLKSKIERERDGTSDLAHRDECLDKLLCMRRLAYVLLVQWPAAIFIKASMTCDPLLTWTFSFLLTFISIFGSVI